MVHAKLPRAGLGNKLLVWANAYLFAYQHNLPLVTSGWAKFHLGPILRKEKSKRFYWNYFSSSPTKNILTLYLKYFLYRRIKNPNMKNIYDMKTLFVFDEVPHHSDYFKNLRESRILIKKAFYAIMSNEINKKLNQFAVPIIAAHIRMGDFNLTARTPIDYFKSIFKSINEISNERIPITIFTDGHENELRELTCIKNVSIFTSNIDIIDMVIMSKAKVIITSTGSTFSYWSAFISEAAIIHYPTDKLKNIRSQEDNISYYEGIFCVNTLKKVLNIQL